MMTRNFHRALRGVAILGGLVLLAGPLAGQTGPVVTARGVAAKVTALGVSQQLASAAVPVYGGLNSGSVDVAQVPGLLNASGLTTITSGMPDLSATTAQTTSELGGVSVLNGLIRAEQVVAVASSYVNTTGAASNGAGSMLLGLVVAGQSIGSTPAPNTRIALPGVGYAVLNEQIVTGDGAGTSGITVNMIHVVLQSILGTKTGEIVLGSATSAVSR